MPPHSRRGSSAPIVLLSVLCVGLAAALVVLLTREPQVILLQPRDPLSDPSVREQVIAKLSASTAAIWDSHNDPAVGRVLQPDIQGKLFKGVAIQSNSYGLRENYFALPKPKGLLRIVLLGDSLVFGEGCAQDQRMGDFLEQFLRERVEQPPQAVEVLHLGIGSWNILAECEYLRRNLSDLQPDVVVQLTTINDLDDGYGVRGFGEKSRFNDLHRERADALVWVAHPKQVLGFATGNHLNRALGFESRQRYAEAFDALLRTQAAVEAQGGRYLHLLHWGGDSFFAFSRLFQTMKREQVVVLPQSFWMRKELWVAEDDPHWNPEGMRLVASLLYGWLRELDALPGWKLPADAEADSMLQLVHGEGLNYALQPITVESLLAGAPVDGEVLGDMIGAEQAGHFNGGVDQEALLSPYASILLRNQGAKTLELELAGLGRAELKGLRVQVYADERMLGDYELPPDETLELSWKLDGDLAARPFMDLRLIFSDFAHQGPNCQHCVCARLVRAALD